MTVKTKKPRKRIAAIGGRPRSAKRRLRASKSGHTFGTLDRDGKRIKAVRLRSMREETPA